MKTCKLYIVRHGESVHNRDRISSGQVNPELTEKGRDQAAATKTKLADVHFDDVYSSDLQRAFDTAAIIYGSPVPPTHKLIGLRERNMGIFDGQSYDLWQASEAAAREHLDTLTDEEKLQHKHHESVESHAEVAERFIGTLASIAEANPGKTILVAAHGGTLRTTLVKLGYATLAELPSGSIENASFVELDYKDGVFTTGTVVGVNKQALHLKAT
jgi:broad specificity phosphatase PhoE